jgi:adenylate cyclase class 2
LSTGADGGTVYEVELKVPANHDAVRQALERIGAESIGVVEQVDTYYDPPHVDFAETDQALRLRTERDRDGLAADATAEAAGGVETESDGTGADSSAGVLTYKGPLVDEESKTRREIESPVLDAPGIDDLLNAVGFDPAATVEKRRERYRVGDVVVTLDTIADLGEFVEVETDVPDGHSASGDDPAIAGARAELESVLRDLELDPADGIRTSYLGLLLEDVDAEN